MTRTAQGASGAAITGAPSSAPHTSTGTAQPAAADRVRAIAPDELRAFAVYSCGPAYTFAPSRPAAFEAWLRRYWETGNSCPEWCFVAERAGRYVGSVVYEGDVRAVRARRARAPPVAPRLPGARPPLAA